MTGFDSLNRDASILIIGAGTFGISTAYHLAKRGYSNVTCIDRNPAPSVDSAGHDLNRVIRTHEEPLYAELTLEALNAWRLPEWNDIFHETGHLTIAQDQDAKTHLHEAQARLQKAGKVANLEILQGKNEVATRVPQLQNAHHIGHGLLNSLGGWVHSRNALERWASEAASMGVKFVSGLEGTMMGIQVGSSGALAGIRVATGAVISADQYILSVGAASSEVLPELSKHLWAKCWTSAQIELTEQEADQWKGIPIIEHSELGFMVEPDPKTRRVSICNKGPGYQYKAGAYTELGRTVRYSIPRYTSSHPHDGIPAEARAGINRFIDTVMPEFSGRPLLDARVYWYADSPDGHWLIDRHPQHKSLLLANGSTSHEFQFFPIIGDYIADALEGNARGLKQEWHYGDRKAKLRSDGSGAEVKDMRDVLGLRLGFKI